MDIWWCTNIFGRLEYNEGNFISILRLLAKSDADLKEHLISGPKNAKYVSKTIQNKILDIAADNIQEYYRKFLRKSSHFSIITDEVTSHGKRIISSLSTFLGCKSCGFSDKTTKA